MYDIHIKQKEVSSTKYGSEKLEGITSGLVKKRLRQKAKGQT